MLSYYRGARGTEKKLKRGKHTVNMLYELDFFQLLLHQQKLTKNTNLKDLTGPSNRSVQSGTLTTSFIHILHVGVSSVLVA